MVKVLKRFCFYLWAGMLVALDQFVKLAVVSNLKGMSVVIIKGILKFTYCENEGVAFSIGNGYVPLFIVINLLLVCGLVLYFEGNRKTFNILDKIFFIMIIAGGLSNVIDRIFRGFVIDFIDVNELFNFAIFNVADIFIVVGVLGFALNYVYKIIKNK